MLSSAELQPGTCRAEARHYSADKGNAGHPIFSLRGTYTVRIARWLIGRLALCAYIA